MLYPLPPPQHLTWSALSSSSSASHLPCSILLLLSSSPEVLYPPPPQQLTWSALSSSSSSAAHLKCSILLLLSSSPEVLYPPPPPQQLTWSALSSSSSSAAHLKCSQPPRSRCSRGAARRPPPWTGPASPCRPGRSSSWPPTSGWSLRGRPAGGPSGGRPSCAEEDQARVTFTSRTRPQLPDFLHPLEIYIYI